MKYLYFFFLVFALFFSCKKKKNTCENGRFDQGEIGVDCGGICPDCVFDKEDILDKEWSDVYPHSDLDSTFVREHLFRKDDNRFFANWGNPSIGILPVSPSTKFWFWINESDTIQFQFTSIFDIKRKILFVGDGFYKFKTDLDGWKDIYPATLTD